MACVLNMADDQGSSVTLIFYKIGTWYREPLLNVLAAAAQMSHLTHVEIAIGESQERDGSMKNVARVFNDDVGVVKKKLRLKQTTLRNRSLRDRSRGLRRS